MILVVLWDIMGKDEHFWWIYLGIYIQESNRVLKHGRWETPELAMEVFPAGTIIKLRGFSSGPPCLIAGG
jgi:hypothetical protein